MERKDLSHIDIIRLIISPDPRKWSRSGPIYNARADPENFDLIHAMIDQGFLTGDTSGSVPKVFTTTWKANDLYLATTTEGVRIRLSFRCGQTLDIGMIHQLAVALHAEFGWKRNRRSKWYR